MAGRTGVIKVIGTYIALLAAPAMCGGTPDRLPKTATRIHRAARPPQIDDYLTSHSSESETAITDFRQRKPRDGASASHPTTVYLSYDAGNLYVVFVCSDDPALVRAHMSRRESISDDDYVGISLDTHYQGRRAYMFFANPLGVQLDGITTEGQPDDYSFDTVWRSEGKRTSTGYIVRFVIPFKSIRFRKDQSTWGIALTRKIARMGEYSTWPYITDRIEAYVPQFAALEGMSEKAAGRNIELMPYGSMASGRRLDDDGVYRASRELRGGLDAKAVLRDTLTLDVTLNPDFSQVESDEPQVTINHRYEVYFPEKRPLFLENAGFFKTPEQLFFSRRIVDPQFGARLTGTLDGWSLGLLAADDRAPGVQDGTGDRAHIGVARVQRDFGGESNAGFLFTTRDAEGGSNRVFSADTRLKLNPNWVFTGQAAASDTRNPAEPARSGTAYFAEIRHAGRHLQYFTDYRDRSAEFQADVGFIPRVDIRQVHNDVSYRWRPEQGPLLSFGPAITTVATWDHSGRLQDWRSEIPFWFNFKGPSSVMISRSGGYEWYRGRGFRKSSNTLFVSSDRWKWLGITASASTGRAINYEPAAGLTPQAGSSLDATLDFTLRPSARVRLDETYFYSRLGLPGQSIFTNHLVRSKLNYQFTRALSARIILDYNAVMPNTMLTGLDRTKRLTTDFLFTYLLHPGTALYLGYTDRRDNPAFAPMLRPASTAWLQTGRQLFVKLSYRLRF